VEAATAEIPPIEEAAPDWLAGLRAAPFEPPEPETPIAEEAAAPDWLAGLRAAPPELETPAVEEAEAPDWLAGLRAAPPELETPSVEEAEAPDWLTSLRAAPPVQLTRTAPTPPEAPAAEAAVPDWLANLQAAPLAPAPPSPPVPEAPVAPAEVGLPAWLFLEEEGAPGEAAPPAPDWLRELRPGEEEREPSAYIPLLEAAIPDVQPEAGVPSWVTPARPPEAVPPSEISAEEEMPDWVRALRPSEAAPVPTPSARPPAAAAPPETTPEEELPTWVREMRPPGLAPTPAAGEAPPEAAAEEELPDWVRALKPAELRAAEAPSAERDAATRPPVLRDIQGGLDESSSLAALSGMRIARPEAPPLPSADLAANFAAVATTPPTKEEAPPAKRRGRFLGGLFQRLLNGVLIIVIAVPLILGTGSAWVSDQRRPTLQGFAGAVKQVAPNDAVLVLVDYEPGGQEEMDPVAEAALYGVITRQARLVALGLTPEGPAIVQQAIQRVAPAGYDYGQHYVVGYLAGEETGLVRATAGLTTTVLQDFVRHEPLDTFAAAQGMTRLSDFRLVLVVGNDTARLERWISQLWSRTQGQPPVIVASSTAAGPLLRAYYDTRQVAGILEGVAGAAEYESVGLSHPARASHRVDPLLYGHLAVIGFVLLGNLAFVIGRLTGA
jgi:hypothetical protein